MVVGSCIYHRWLWARPTADVTHIYKPKWCTLNINILLRMDYTGHLDDIFSVRISFLQKQNEQLFCLHAKGSFVLLDTEPKLKYEKI